MLHVPGFVYIGVPQAARGRADRQVRAAMPGIFALCQGHLPSHPHPAAELLRENKRLIDKSIREIDRERNSLQMQENKLINEMKKNAKNGQMVLSPSTPLAKSSENAASLRSRECVSVVEWALLLEALHA